jgi:hypothetical protein
MKEITSIVTTKWQRTRQAGPWNITRAEFFTPEVPYYSTSHWEAAFACNGPRLLSITRTGTNGPKLLYKRRTAAQIKITFPSFGTVRLINVHIFWYTGYAIWNSVKAINISIVLRKSERNTERLYNFRAKPFENHEIMCARCTQLKNVHRMSY